MGGCLSKAHQHPKLPKLTPVGNKVRVIRRDGLEWGIVEASFQVQHPDSLSSPELCPVLLHVVELVLILGHPLVDPDNVLTYLVRLPRLNAQY